MEFEEGIIKRKKIDCINAIFSKNEIKNKGGKEMFIKTVIRQGEQINELNKENKVLYEENKELRFECEELKILKDRIKRIIFNADLTKENYFITLKKIKEELDAYENTLVQNT